MILYKDTAYCPHCGYRTVNRAHHDCPRRVREELKADRAAAAAQLPAFDPPSWFERLAFGCYLLGRDNR